MLKNKIVALLIFIFACFTAQANEHFDYRAFGTIPVAHEGRIKPLSRYAALLYKNVTGDYPETEQQGSAWLAALLFDPTGAADTVQFHIPNKNVIYALDLPFAAEYYNFDDVNAAFLKKKDLVLSLQKAEEPTEDERAVSDLYIHASAFEQTKDAMTLVLPLRAGKDKDAPVTFDDLAKDNPLYKSLLTKGRANTLLRIIPLDGTWVSPWDNALSPQPSALIDDWKKVASAYVRQDSDAWKKETASILRTTLKNADDASLPFRLHVERLYQQIDPYFYSFVFYLLGFFVVFTARRNSTRTVGLGLIGTGLSLHALGLAARMIILQRPPVSTLYESIVFVGFMATALFLVFAYRQKREGFLILSALSGVLFYLIALSSNDGQDDLKVLEAVLNTRFWLATHVLAITTGYALCALAAFMAHAYIAAKAFGKRVFFSTKEFAARIYQLSAWALLFVAGGTLLGGVWADQSWGRFWGWDPKENGALLIVLWLTWLLHAKLSKHFDMDRFIFGAAFLSIIVAFSWLGVNLLGVGLHSYGFTSGLATGFASFCIGDILILILLWIRGRKHGAFAATL